MVPDIGHSPTVLDFSTWFMFEIWVKDSPCFYHYVQELIISAPQRQDSSLKSNPTPTPPTAQHVFLIIPFWKPILKYDFVYVVHLLVWCHFRINIDIIKIYRNGLDIFPTFAWLSHNLQHDGITQNTTLCIIPTLYDLNVQNLNIYN